MMKDTIKTARQLYDKGVLIPYLKKKFRGKFLRVIADYIMKRYRTSILSTHG